MTVNYEIKGMLAKLLATEDIIVEHKKVETACFNVHTRVLTLPMWKASSTVVDLLIAHEVGHSRETPDADWTKDHKIPPQYVNICEDARVEKLMKRRYSGLAKTFFNGYKELFEEDFFCIGNDDVSNYNLADRVNLYFKIGNFLPLKFSSEEEYIVNAIGSAETFGETLKASELLYNYCKKFQEKVDSITPPPSNSDQQASSLSETVQNSESNSEISQNSSEFDVEESEGGQSEKESQSIDGEQIDETFHGSEKSEQLNDPEVKTVNSFEESVRELADSNGFENVYVEIPELDLDKVIVPNSEIHQNCESTWNSFLKDNSYNYSEIFLNVDNEFSKFERSTQKEVNYLVKEFECRKSADSYARASTSRTGILDCTRLHTYKYEEDLFKKITTLADGKNHGLVFILDWSGSMSNVMLDTVKQLFNLVWFCRKVSIPFEVYAFTTDHPLVKYAEDGKASFREFSYVRRDGLIQVGEWFSLMNILTSKVNTKTLNEQMKNIFRIASAYSGRYYSAYPIPTGMTLSGTPLNETLISLHQILPKFQKDYKLQKVQCVILTDGEGNPPKYHREVIRKWEDSPFLGLNHITSGTYLRDRKTGNTYKFGNNWHQATDVFLKNLRDKFKDINFIGIRILDSRDVGNFVRLYYTSNQPEFEKIMNSWKKEKAFSIKNSGYNTYFGISSNALSQNSEFEVAEDASKSQIKNAFMKSLRSKKMNKRVLGEFIELVA